MPDGLTRPVVVGYSLKQVLEMLLPASAAFVAIFLTFTDFREATNTKLELYKQVQDVTERRITVLQGQTRETANEVNGVKAKVDVIEERTRNTQEDVKETQTDVKEVKALINEALRKLNQQ